MATKTATKTDTTTTAPVAQKAEAGGRARSTLRFPYYSLNQALEMAAAIRNRGGGACSLDQLAAYLSQSPKSGAFMMKLAAARMFGLITNVEDGVVRVTGLGMNILAPTYPGRDDRRARLEAFDNIPLFEAMLRHLDNADLPPTVGIDNALRNQFHVPASAVPEARRTFMDSADQAGFFEATGGRTRLVRPTVDGGAPPLPPAPGGSGGGGGSGRDGSAGGGGGTPDGGGARRDDGLIKIAQGIPRSVAGMLASLPPENETLTEEDIEELVTMFKIALKRAYKKRE